VTIELFARERPEPTTTDAAQRMHGVHAEHSRAVLQFLITLTNGERHAAEDLLQETMIRAWRKLDTIPPDYETTRRWLFVVARRVAIDAIRMRQARPSETGLVDLARMPTPDTAEAVITREALNRAARTLSDAHRLILSDLYIHDRTIEETARRRGLPVGTVKSRAHYALRLMRAALKFDG
jgi:RNA polymerase sigma-70 factor (ECF subfamily)